MKRLYKDNTAQLDIFLGYSDAGGEPPYNTNAIDRAYLIQKLYRECAPPTVTEPCGFKAEPQNADRLSKALADGREFVIRVHDGVKGVRDDLNRNDPGQERLTGQMNEKFKKALRESEAVFYIGHSRDGGGPDFGPPKLLANGHTDYEWYRKNRPGLRMIEESMSKGHPEFYGSFSCDSLNHFSGPIRKKNSEVLYFGTTRITSTSYYTMAEAGVRLPYQIVSSEVIDSSLLTISGMITQKCDFNTAFQGQGFPVEADYE
jgi:hypothetical protein